ncbi:MAG TPA: retropepsin-like aspartic protease [Puia sp.]|nr:retropepsin-like aspartic protease [Puia sp.]
MKYTSQQIFAVAAVLVPLLFLAGCAAERQVDAPAVIRPMDSLLDQKDYFRLERQLAVHSAELSESRRLYFAAIVDNAFNRNRACMSRVDSVIRMTSPGLSDSLVVNLLRYQDESYFRTGQYAAAARVDSLLLGRYKKAMDSGTRADIRNDLLIRNALRDLPPQEVTPGAGTEVPWNHDGIGLIEFPIRLGNQTVNAIFDTRANISSVTRTYAEKLHLRVLDVSYDESSGMTGIHFKVGLGVADSLWVGSVVVRHAIFQVMPDSILYIAPIRFQLNLIVGYPVIAGLQEVRLTANGKLAIPSEPVPADLHNLALDRLDPVIRLASGRDTLLFDFDSGADNTVLYSGYFQRHRAAVLRSGIEKKTSLGGAGGVKTNKTYVLPVFSLSLGKQTVAIDSVAVLTEKIFPGERLSGNLGRDFMSRFSRLVIDFKYMYVQGQ